MNLVRAYQLFNKIFFHEQMPCAFQLTERDCADCIIGYNVSVIHTGKHDGLTVPLATYTDKQGFRFDIFINPINRPERQTVAELYYQMARLYCDYYDTSVGFRSNIGQAGVDFTNKTDQQKRRVFAIDSKGLFQNAYEVLVLKDKAIDVIEFLEVTA